MNKDLQNIDEVFNAAYREFEDDPSPEVWQKINEELDKKNTASFKKRFIVWKRTAMLLLLLLAGFVLYESGVLKQGSRNANKNTAVQKINTSVKSPGKTNTDNNPDAVILNSNNTLIEQDQKNIPVINSTDFQTGKTQPVKKEPVQKNNPVNQQSNALAADIKTGNPVIGFRPAKDKPLTNNDFLPLEKINSLQPIEKNSIAKTPGQPANNVKQSALPAVNDSSLKNNTAKKEKQKKKNSFKPFWMITPFVSYDQAGYRLDSDEPSAIKSIKFREAHEPSFSAGLLLTRQLLHRWGLQSGIIYSKTAIGMKPQKTYAFQNPTGNIAYKYITSSGYAFIKPGFGPQPAVGDSLTTAEAKHTLEQISVPLTIQHTVTGKKISITSGAGIEANFISKANLEVDIEDAFNREIVSINKLQAAKSFYWSFVAEAELKYKINKKIAVTVRPVYRQAISPITKNNVVETFPHNFGFGAGVTVKL